MKLFRYTTVVFLGLVCAASAQVPSPSDSTDCESVGCVTPTAGPSTTIKAPKESSAVVLRNDKSAAETDTDDNAVHRTPGANPANRAHVPQVRPLTDFQKLVADTVGHEVPVFGQGLFADVPSDFEASASISAPGDYVIGPGDELRIHTWGKVDTDVRLTVDTGGQIFIPVVGPVTVAGLRADQLNDTIKTALSRQFKGFELEVTLGRLRSIQIFVLGQAEHPGVYTISSLSTLINALFACGGPSASGTLRDIQVKRHGQVVANLDVYQFLVNGDKSHDIHLLPGDIIFIPPVGHQFAVDGEVTTPGIFEMKGDTSVEQAIEDAGGLTPTAGTTRISIDRVFNHEHRTVDNVTLEMVKQTSLLSDDIVRVYPISSEIVKSVTLRGSVGSPGRYPWHPGMHITDLIPSREFLLARNYFNRKNSLDPGISDNPFTEAAANDAARGTTTRAITNTAAGSTQAISVEGAVSNPDLASHDSEIDWKYSVIERLGTTDFTTHLIPFALGEAIDHPSSPENKELQPGDIVVVYAQKDINLPQELTARFVRIDGEVVAPGIYRVGENETLQDVLRRAGGLAPGAYLYAAQLTRNSVRIAQEIRLRELLERQSLEALSPANVKPSSTDTAADSQLALRQAYIAELSKLRPTGRVVLQLNPSVSKLEDVPNFDLQDGDHFFVPSRPNTVDVLGSVYNQGALRFLPKGHVHTYLDASGGVTRDGDKRRAFVMRADGTLVDSQNVHGFKNLPIYPGDSVIVPANLKPPFSFSTLIGATESFGTLALLVLAIKSLQ